MPRKKKQREPEYRLRVFKTRDSGSTVAMVVETTKEFVNFQYELLIADERKDRSIAFKILGIHTPRSVMPGIGPARGFRRYENLSSPLTITVHNPDGVANTFKIAVRRSDIILMESPRQPFVDFSTEPVTLPE